MATCAGCGRDFTPRHYLQRYCTRACRNRAQNRRFLEAHGRQTAAPGTPAGVYHREQTRAAMVQKPHRVPVGTLDTAELAQRAQAWRELAYERAWGCGYWGPPLPAPRVQVVPVGAVRHWAGQCEQCQEDGTWQPLAPEQWRSACDRCWERLWWAMPFCELYRGHRQDAFAAARARWQRDG